MSARVNKSLVRECLRELADYEFQKRTWLASTGPEVSSFSELISQLYDDTGLGDALEGADLIFDARIDGILREIDKAASHVNQRLPASQLLEEPSMKVIRRLATEAIEGLESKKGLLTMIKLSEKLAIDLAAMPETGMGYHVVNVELKDGRKFEQVIIIEGLISEIRGLKEIPFTEDQIDKINLTHNKWDFNAEREPKAE